MENKNTIKKFWEDSYLTSLKTKVTSVIGNQITVHETIFYALSGGQESDHGTIGDYVVEKAEKRGKDILYTISANHGLKVGDTVLMKIDWDRRYKLMKLHFAAEIVLELVYHHFPNITKVGAHIAAEKARIDFEMHESISPHIQHLQEKAQSIIETNQQIISAFSDVENERRYWKIEEFSQVPCGGTHLKRTAEIGKIRLKRINPGKGKERIEIYLGDPS